MEITRIFSQFEFQFLIYLTVLFVFIVLNIYSYYHYFLKRRRSIFGIFTILKTRKPISLFPYIFSGFLNLAIVILCFNGLYQLLSLDPKVTGTTPAQSGVQRSYKDTVIFEFDAPIDFNKLITHSAPNVNGAWIPVRYFNRLPFGRKIIFKPEISYSPGEKVMIYLSNIRRPLARKFGGEFLLEFNAPTLPSILASDPPDQATDVVAGNTISFNLTSQDSPQSIWDFEINPPRMFTVKRNNTNRLSLLFADHLSQGTTYRISVFQTPAIINLKTRGTSDIGQRKMIHQVSFTTVRSPFIKSFKPDGENIVPGTPIEIEFDQPMKPESLISHLNISPQASGSSNWINDSIGFRFIPALQNKNTNYTVTLQKGILSQAGGILENDVSYHYRTLGTVIPLSVDPPPDNRNIPADAKINITFDQEVNHVSAQNKFSFTPRVSGTFSWTGNTMTFSPDQPLSYATDYSYSLDSGIDSRYGLPSNKKYGFVFKTLPEQFSLDVPYFKQQENFTCNIAATRMMLAFRGIIKTESELKAEIGSNGSRSNGNPHLGYVAEYGTYWEPIAKEVNKYRPAKIYRNWNLPALLNEVRLGKPVMVWAQNGWSDPHDISWDLPDGTHIYAVNGMHSYVVTGFSGPIHKPTQILVNDPWRGQYGLPIRDFLNLWHYFFAAMVVD